MPIVMGMVAGVFLRFGLDLGSRIPRRLLDRRADDRGVPRAVGAGRALARALPPLIGALIVGAVRDRRSARFAPGSSASRSLARPDFYVPAFSWQAMVELVVPLAITVLVVQNGQGIAVLTRRRPPAADQRHHRRLRRRLDRCRLRRRGVDLPHRTGQRHHLRRRRQARAVHRGRRRRRCSRWLSALVVAAVHAA